MVKIISTLITVVGFLNLPQLGSASAFLKKQEGNNQTDAGSMVMGRTTIEMRFLEKVRGFVGKGAAADSAELSAIRKALEPMWLAMPKSDEGRADIGKVRYMLHRYFVQRHGWHVDGLDHRSVGKAPPANGVERQHVPMFLMDLFEEAFGQSGLMLHEVAIFAATLEEIIHVEATNRLTDVYRVLSWSTNDYLSDADVDAAMKAYLMSLLLGEERLETIETVQKSYRQLVRTYPAWADTLMWMQDIRETVTYLDQGRYNPFVENQGWSFSQVLGIVEQISQQIGRFQDGECRHLKDMLLEEEDRDSGRLTLTDFYKKGMETDMQFAEKPAYLRHLGALDESKSGEPRVIVTNYILSQSNCLANMGFYSICCINECEHLMADIEARLATPRVLPAQMAAVVGKLSTSTVEADGALSPTLTRRLEEIAAANGGEVPLHGRLFAQWLHFAFPRECPYPVAAGKTNPLTAAEWMAIHERPSLKRKEMNEYIESAQLNSETMTSDDDEGLMRWSDEEEILYLPEAEPRSWPMTVVRAAILPVSLLGLAAAGLDAVRRAGGSGILASRKEKSHLV